MIEKKNILNLSRENSISSATLGQYIELLLHVKKNDVIENGVINQEKLIDELKILIHYSKEPQKWFSIRQNLSKLSSSTNNSENKVYLDAFQETNQEFKDKINQFVVDNGFHCRFDKIIPNLLYFKVNGPNKLENNGKHITIDRFASESVMLGANLYIPGFNKFSYDFEKEEHVSVYSPGSVHVGNGITKINSQDLFKQKKGLGIEMTISKYSLPKYRDSSFYSEGFISDQSLPPILGCWLLMSFYKKGNKILDLCSAPGHKTCSMSEIGFHMNKGIFPEIVSVDRSKNRLKTLHNDILRLNLLNVRVVNSKIEKLKVNYPELTNFANLAILDPPCSALGIRPKLVIENSWKDFRSLFLIQRSLIKLVDEFIVPGGILLYNTCTMTLLENESVVFYALDRLGYELIDAWEPLEKLFKGRFKRPDGMEKRGFLEIKSEFGHELHYGIARDEDFLKEFKELNDLLETEDNNERRNEFKFENVNDLDKYFQLNEKQSKKVIRFFPDNMNSTGYFIALLRKKKD